jgi:hypothetical protein
MTNLFRNRWITLYSGMDSDKFSRLTYTLKQNRVKFRERVIDETLFAGKSGRRGIAYSTGMSSLDETAAERKPGYVVQIPYRSENSARKVCVKHAL